MHVVASSACTCAASGNCFQNAKEANDASIIAASGHYGDPPERITVFAATGKFYIVGMGTAPDLITVRGVEVIKSADLILLEQPSELDTGRNSSAKRKYFTVPMVRALGLGMDPKKVEDPDIRSIVENNAKHRQEAVARIKKEVEAGKIVVALEGGDPMIMARHLPRDVAEGFPFRDSFQASAHFSLSVRL